MTSHNHHNHNHQNEHAHSDCQSVCDSHHHHSHSQEKNHHSHEHNYNNRNSLPHELDHSHHGHHNHSHTHEQTHHSSNENLYGVYLHILADLLGSIGVIASSILILMFGWHITDAICSAITSLLILVSVFPLLKNSILIFLQTYPFKKKKHFHKALKEISNHRDIIQCKDPHLWAFTHDKLVCSVILVIRSQAQDIQKVLNFAEERINNIGGIKYINIDYEIEKI